MRSPAPQVGQARAVVLPTADQRHGDTALLERLRAGDEAAFRDLVSRHHRSMVRVARTHVPTDAVAEEVVQEAWLGVIKGLHRFEGRSSVKTWIFRIVVNRAKTRGAQERRTVAFSSLVEDGNGSPAVDPDRFLPPDDARPTPATGAAPRAPWDSFPRTAPSPPNCASASSTASTNCPHASARSSASANELD